MKILHKISNLLFPTTCRMCGGKSETTICESCKDLFLKETFEHCPACGLTALNCSCNNDYARHTKTVIDHKNCIALTFYKTNHTEGRLTEKMIFLLKDRGEFAKYFAKELSRAIKSSFAKEGIDVTEWTVTYIPRSAENLAKSGFDQGEEVARRLAKLLGVKFVKTFKRAEIGTAQKYLGAKERKENVENSLAPVKRNIRTGGKFLLFDDIVTTGATVETAAKHLYFCGAEEVFPVVIAKREQNYNKTKYYE